jgi:hypothetical protein
LSSGCLASTSSANLAVTEGRAAVKLGDEIWILFGCPTLMVLRRNGPYFIVVSPAYIADIVNGQVVEGVVSPCSGNTWDSMLKSKRFGPKPEDPYVSGKGKWLAKLISLR